MQLNHQATPDLVQSAVLGDREPFGLLIIRHAAMVTGVAYSVCGDFPLSEDIGQEAFIEAWKSLATLRDPEKFAGWICTIARRRAVDAVRAAKPSRANRSLDNIPFEIRDPNQLTPEANMSQNEERELVWSLLARLPEGYREPMVLFYRCEESTRDVALALGENEATIRQRLKRGREMLRADVGDAIRKTLGESAPKAAFAALVMASLPSTTYAAGAAATTLAAGKTSGLGSAAASSAIGGALFGSLIGVLGGAFGTWMSWQNSEYESQQKLIVRQAVLFVAGMAVFCILLAILITARLRGSIASDAMYGGLLGGLILVSQGLNFLWMWRTIRDYKRLTQQAKAAGLPIREPVQRARDAARCQLQVTEPDENTGFEGFRWYAGGWFGSCIGATAWLLPLAAVSFWFESTALGVVTSVCFAIGMALTITTWCLRARVPVYIAYQAMLAVMFLLTTIVLTALQWIANAKTQEYTEWTPWAWLILIVFPLVSLRLWWMRRSIPQSQN